nr:cation:dicarboxylase symporter family transporter [Butyrivibrio sp. VCD2006]
MNPITFFKGMMPAIMFAFSSASSVGLPIDGIALVAGVDRIFDMGRTTLNITGDASCTVIVSNMLKRREAKKSA